MNLVPLTTDILTQSKPNDQDFDEHAVVLELFMEHFSLKVPNEAIIVSALVGLDNLYRRRLSKVSTLTAQRRWAQPDAIALRFLLTYIFNLVRTSKGKTTSRNPTIGRLKSYVRTDAVFRRQREDAEQYFRNCRRVWAGPPPAHKQHGDKRCRCRCLPLFGPG